MANNKHASKNYKKNHNRNKQNAVKSMKQNLTVQVDENAHSNQQAATFEKLNHGQSTDTKKATVFVETLAKQTLTPKKTTSVLMPKTPVLMPKTPVSAPEEVLLAATDEDMLYDFECEDIDIEDAPETSDSTHIHVAMKSWVQDYKQSLAGQKPSGDAYYPKPHRLDYMLERGVERCPPLAFSRAKERQQPTFSLSPVPLDAKVIAEIKMRKASLPFPTTVAQPEAKERLDFQQQSPQSQKCRSSCAIC